MTTPIGYATLQIIPSLKGVSEEINKQLGGQISVSGKRAGAQFGKGVADGLKSTESDVKRATDAYGKLADKAKDSLGQIVVAEAKLEKARAGGKQDMIVAAEERLAKVRRDSLRTSKEAEAAHSALVAVQGRLGSSTDNLGGRFSGLSTTVGGVGSALTSVGAIAGGAALVGITALAAGAVKATRELYDLGASFDDLRDKLQISTGASGAQLQGLVDVVERLGTTTVASKFADIGTVVADVTRNLHLTGPALDDVTSRLANLSRMTGEAVNVRELGKAFRGFGVDAKDQAGALNSLYEASTKSGLSINDMLASVVKGGPALRQFGLSFGESAALVNTFEQAGVDTDKTLAALNKAFGAFAKAGIPAKQGLSDVITNIHGLIAAGDEAGAADLTNQVFGVKGGVNFFELIKTGAVDLQALSTTLQSTGLDINKVAQDTGDWAEHWTTLKNKIETALEPIAGPVFEGINAKLDLLATWVGAHQGEIIDFFVSVGDMAINTADAVHGFVASTLSDMGLFADLAAKIVGGMATIDEALDHIPGMGGNQQEAAKLRNTQQTLQDLASTLKKDSSKTDAAREAWDKAKDSLHALGEEAKTAASHTDILAQSMVDGKQVFGPFVGAPFVSGAPAASTTAGGGGVPLTQTASGWTSTNPEWAKLIARESGGQNIKQQIQDVNSGGNEGFGLFQITPKTWAAHGGQGSVYDSTPEQQAVVAANILRANPSGADWGLNLGIGREDASKLLAGLGAGGGGMPYGLPAGSDSGGYGGAGVQFPDWVNQLGASFGLKPSTYPGHQEGSGLNKGIDWSGPVDAMQRFAEYLATVPSALEQVIWSNPQTGRKIGIAGGQFVGPGTSQPGYYAGDWADHEGHVHTRQSRSIPLPGGGQPNLSALGSGIISPIDMSRMSGAGAPMNAFGPGYEPGIGTPGYNEYGDPGYWRTDPKTMRNAQRAQEDSQQAIQDADDRIADARQKRADLEEEFLATAEEKLKADKDISVAERAAARARQDAQDAQENLADAQKGRFTEAKKAAKTKGFGGLPSLTNFSGIGGALGEFAGGQLGSALDVFGVGDSPGWLQGIGQFMGGIRVGGSGGGSVSPLSALGGGGAAASLTGAHGGTGQQPGPAGVTYNINNTTGNDDLITLLRRREQELGAMLGRF